MRKVLFPVVASLAALSAATPALANEARVEARGGIAWSEGESEAVVGAAAGYDFDLGNVAFAGVEVSGDKILTDNTIVSFGVSGRVGGAIGTDGKLYAVGGWNSKLCSYFCDDLWSVGAGYQHNIGQKLYGKVEYRHFFGENDAEANTVLVGLGTRF